MSTLGWLFLLLVALAISAAFWIPAWNDCREDHGRAFCWMALD